MVLNLKFEVDEKRQGLNYKVKEKCVTGACLMHEFELLTPLISTNNHNNQYK